MIPQLKNPYERQAYKQRDDLNHNQYMKLMAKGEAYNKGWVDFKEAIEPKIQELLSKLYDTKICLEEIEIDEATELVKQMIKLLKP